MVFDQSGSFKATDAEGSDYLTASFGSYTDHHTSHKKSRVFAAATA